MCIRDRYTTGEIAKLCGVSVRTVQYYDSKNILNPSAVTEGGRRIYNCLLYTSVLSRALSSAYRAREQMLLFMSPLLRMAAFSTEIKL